MQLQQVKKQILSRIKPSRQEEKKINSFIEELLGVARVVSRAKPIIVGSLGRGTWLSGDHDIDLFLMFDKGVSRDGLEKMGMENAREIAAQLKGKPTIKYAEHPYIRADFSGIMADIVPCYEIKPGEKIISAVDRSPLHVEYVVSKLSENMRDEARLLKQFCKGIGVYGSDARNLGVSGYICELLIIKHGSFERALKEISRLAPGSIIDIENHWYEGEESEKHLKKAFGNHPLILIDPVDKDRNVASSLSCENMIRFSFMAGEFLKRPSEKFFFPKPQALSASEFNKLRERKTKFFAIAMCKPDIIDDILYPQLRKTMERLEKVLAHNEFRILRDHILVDEELGKIFLAFEMECWELPFINNMRGPPIFAAKNSKDFLKKYSRPMFGPFVMGCNWVIEKQRNFKTADAAVRDFLWQSPAKLHENGIPDHIAKEITKPKILEHEAFWNLVRGNKRFSAFMRQKYFEHY
jgi:tRNA nucleotidyltransferase (CCA-adding enzyme)